MAVDGDEAMGWVELALRLKTVRELTGTTQTALSRALGVSQSHISDVERLASKPSIELVLGISKEFPLISRNWLLTGEGSPNQQSSLSVGLIDGEFRGSRELNDVRVVEPAIAALHVHDALSERQTARKARQELYEEFKRFFVAAHLRSQQTGSRDHFAQAAQEVKKYAASLAGVSK